MSVNVYFNFNGNTREVVEFYAEVFGIEDPQIMAFGDVPADPNHPLPEGTQDLVMHANLKICGSSVMFSDVFPGRPFTHGNNITVAIVHDNVEELQSYFHKMKAGGTIEMELQETFWSKCYGSLVDKFGINWQFSYRNEENPL
ncbi:VOC family protein [Paenibacillus sp. N1-5-1-14]|uniref:VOC family protein n=1 Tax=Paenibacillus radicibacter TaxID=2972488 RepID=UPI0021598724|nr:VOC family protein [Paenibacillus radicibacter]MCR8641659.1 VOC family protein [Paenibacillus radicibacter]